MIRKLPLCLLKHILRKDLLFLLCFSLSFLSLSAQVYTSISSTVPVDLTICGAAKTFTITIYNASPYTLNNSGMQVNMPTGVNYSVGSITGAGQFNISVPNAPEFSLGNIPTLTTVTMTFQASADCGVLAFLNSGNPIQNQLVLSYTANSVNNSEFHTTNTYAIKQPNLSITSFTNQTYSGNIGDTFTRCITITNGGFGELSQFTLTDSHGTDVQILNVSAGTWSTAGSIETIVLGPAEFALIGNGNGFFETGESITICQTVQINNCTSVFSNFEASWGCNTQACQTVATTANIVFLSLTPNLQVTSTTQTNSCTGPGNLNAQQLKIINTGLGQALNVSMNIFQATGTGFNANMQSSIDVGSFTLQINSGAPATYSNVAANGASACPGGVGRVQVTFPQIASGDTLYLKWNVSTCCPTVCNAARNYMGWRYDGTYTNVCQTNYLVPNTLARGYSHINWNLANNGSPSSIVSGQTSAFNFLTTYITNSYPVNANSQWKYVITLPPCLTYNPLVGDFHILHFNGIAQWFPSSINIVGNTITAFFDGPPPFSLAQSELKMNLTADCSSCTGGMGAITVNTYYISDSNCSCEYLVGCFSNNIEVVCPQICEGLNFQGFDIKRISYGLPDNNNDGLADGVGTLDFNKVRRDRAMFGDTLRATYNGLVKTSLANPSWEYGYIQGVFSGIGGAPLTGLGGSLYVYRLGLLLGIAPIAAATVPPLTFNYDISAAALIATGNFAPGFVYLDDDSLVFEADYRVSGNIGGNFANANCANEFYVSNVPNPALIDRYSCNELQGNFSLIGYYFTNYGPDNYTVTECNQVVISQNYYLSIGPCCQNYAGGNLFPFEYRYWSHIKNLRVINPIGYEFVSAQFRDIRTAGTFSGAASPWFPITPMVPGSDTMDFFVEPFFLGNPSTIPRSDDGFYGTIQVTLSPTCLVTPNINQSLGYYWTFENGPFLIGSPTPPVSNTTQDFLEYFGPQLQLQSPLPQVNALTNTVSWDVIITNIENFSAQNTWISIPQNTGVTVIQVEELPSGTIYALTGDFYQIGTTGAASSRTFRITAQYSSCVTDSIVVNVGWNCGGYPASLPSYICTPVTITLSLVPQPAYFVTNITGPAAVDLCETAEYTAELKNVQLGSAYNVFFNLTLPIGVSIVPGSSQSSYPNGSAFTGFPDPVNIGGSTWQYDLSAMNATVGTNGLSGILDTLTNTFKIKFSVKTDCDYTSGNWIDFLFAGETGCGMIVQDQTTLAIPITQAIAYSTTINLQTTYVKPCSDSSSFLISIKNIGPSSFGTLDSVQVIMPGGVFFVPGSFVPVYNTSFVNPVPAQTIVNGQVHLLWGLTTGIAAGDSIVFVFDYFGVPDSLECQLITFTVNSLSTANVTCVTTGNSCDINTITGSAQIPVFVFKGNLSITSATASAVPNPPAGETVNLSVVINNNGDSIYASTGAYLHYYYDFNGNGILDSLDIFIDTEYLATLFPTNGNVTHNTQINFPAGQACAILVVIDNDSTTCSCSSSEFLVIPALLNAGPDSTLCAEQQVLLGFPATNGYTYSWSPTTGLNNPLSSNPVLTAQNTTGVIQIWQYVLTTDRINCTSSDTVIITVYPLPVVNIGNDTVFCFGDSIIVNAGAGANSYLWNTGATSQTETINSTGTYWVDVIDQNGCQNYDTIGVIVNPLPVINLGNDTAICNGALLTLDAGPGMVNYSWNTGGSTQTITVGSQGTYDATIIDVNGCLNSDTIFVIVNPLPIVNLDNDTSICNGQLLTLNAGPGMVSYVWNTGANTQTIPVSSQGTYAVTVLDVNDCENSDTIFVVVNPLPFVNLGNDTAICSGQLLTLDAGPGMVSYVWNTGANTQTIPVSTQGTYDVTVLDVNDCENSDTIFVTVNSLPLIDFGNDSAICTGATLLLDSGPGMASYSWNTGAITPTITVSNQGSYDATIIDVNGCQNSDTIFVTVNPLPAINLGNDTAICNGALLTLDAGPGMSSYLWSTGAITSTINEGNQGTYDVLITDLNGCQSSDTIIVNINLLPVVNIGNDTAICNGSSLLLDAGAGMDGYFWNTGANTQTVTVTNQASYNVSVIDTNACVNADTIFITVNPLPVVNIGNDTAICQGATLTLDAGPGLATYLWSNNASTQTVTISAPGTYSVTVTDANGCQGSNNINIIVNSLPVVNLGNDTIFCDGNTLMVDAGAGFNAYAWSTGTQTQTESINATGVYGVNVIDLNGCENSDTIEVVVNPLPVVNLGNDTILCSYSPFLLDAGITSSYLWQDGSTNSTYSVTQSGTYEVTVTNSFNCSATDQIIITVNSLPQVGFYSNELEGCPPLTSTFIDNSSIAVGSNTDWQWDFGDGTTASGDTVIHEYTTTGFYNVSLTVTSAQGCTTTTTLNNYINVYPVPTAGFTASPEEVSIFNPLVHFYDHSTGAEDYFWDFGNSFTSTEVNTSHAYPDSGTYQVTLLVTNLEGCTDSITGQVRVNPEFTLFFPNAFTPNGSGENDIFYGYGEGISEYELLIFDRWGEQIFQSTSIHNGWDGKYKGKMAPEGVYVYVCYGKTFKGKHFKVTGHVTLIR